MRYLLAALASLSIVLIIFGLSHESVQPLRVTHDQEAQYCKVADDTKVLAQADDELRSAVGLTTEELQLQPPTSRRVFIKRSPQENSVSQEELGRIIVMVSEGWDHWPAEPVCEDLGRGWKEVPCRIGNHIIDRQPPVESVIDPDHYTVPEKWGL